VVSLVKEANVYRVTIPTEKDLIVKRIKVCTITCSCSVIVQKPSSKWENNFNTLKLG